MSVRRRLRPGRESSPRRVSVVARAGRLVPARWRGADDALAGRRLMFAMCGAFAGATAGGSKAFVAPVLLGGLGWRLGSLVHDRAARARSEAIRASLPEAVDLLALCALGGMGIEPSIRLVARGAAEPLRSALNAFVSAVDVGLPRERAYDAFASAAACQEAVALVAALARAERYGAPLADTLVAQAAEARDAQRSRIRERAMGAPVRMLFPLTLCFLPAFVLIAIAPSLVVAFQSFRQW